MLVKADQKKKIDLGDTNICVNQYRTFSCAGIYHKLKLFSRFSDLSDAVLLPDLPEDEGAHP